jgi:predicted deacylase
MYLPTAIATLILAAATATPPPPAVPQVKPAEHDIRPGPGVTRVARLQDYLPALVGTAGDTAVYFLQGAKPGGVALVVGGTHANEIAGIVAAIVLVESATVERGTLIVIPHANNSAILGRDPDRPGPETIAITTPSGPRVLRYGARRTLPQHQGRPDPAEFRHPASSEVLAGREARNLDRAYPGRADGDLTQRIAAAVIALLAREKVGVALDLHEAAPASRLAWMLVAHPKSLEVAAAAVIELDAAGIAMKLEHSSEGFRGLSHREWGDASSAHTFLVETPNPAQRDGAAGADPVGDPQYPLSRRVAVHLATITAVIAAATADAEPAGQIVVTSVPTPESIGRSGIGAFMR